MDEIKVASADVIIDPNDPNIIVKKTTMKISKVIEAGFLCDVCATQTITHDQTIPVACLNCHAPKPKIVWRNIITNTITVKSIL